MLPEVPMPGICAHEFFWPLKAADGNYYQVCRLCGAQHAYDWNNMRRMRGGPPASLTSGLSAPKASPQPNSPRLNLLVELEPAHRVFLDNLADALRPAPPAANGLPHVPFWREVLFYSDIPWQRFAESMVCHMVALAALLLLSQMWTSEELPRRRSMFENSHLTYYKPSDSFPALRASPPRVRAAFKKTSGSAPRGSIRVAPEPAQASSKPPDIKLSGKSRPNIVASKAILPEMPLASTRPSRLNAPAGPTALIAPPPEVSQATSRRLGMPQASGVAPPPEAGAVSSRRAMTVPGAAVIGPPPVLQASIRRVGDIDMGPATVVAPSPRLPVGEQSTIAGGAQATLGSPIVLAVPPPPSAPHGGALADGRAGSLPGGGWQVVPPPPSVQAVNNPAGGGRLGSMPGGGLQAVPPAPSLQGASNSGADGRAASIFKAGSNNGVQAVAPAPTVGDAGNGGRGGSQMAMGMAPALAPASPPIIDNAKQPDNVRQQAAEKPPEPATEEMPLRLIGMAMALPTSSYFSNYEVFIAERKLSKGLAQLIKLVYVSLPYQRRLSEYGVDNTKVYKLRVSRDRSCDESLIQMTWPEGDPHPDMHNAADSPALSAEDRKNMLPCYRTTADDYRKAISRR
jgi:hypothetical protein